MLQEYSFHGEWNFRLDPESVGMKEKWQEQNVTDKIQIPGILQAQGYGEDISETTPWVSSLYDKLWFLREEYKTASQELNIPFLCQPPKHYLGKAWYQKNFIVSEQSENVIFNFRMECVKWKTSVWVDDHFAGSETSLCTPHNYCLGKLKKGEHRITVCVDNSLLYPYRPDGHMLSDALGASWNGITGAVTVMALPEVHMEKLWINPEFDTKKVSVMITIQNLTGKEQKVRVQVNETVAFAWIKEQLRTVTIELSYPEDSCIWDEYTKGLHKVTASVEYKGIRQEKTETFGFRKIEARDGLFFVNNRPAYFRGTHFGRDFPLTGFPSTEVSDWRRIIRTCKEWGLNYIRFHSFCPPEAAFTAADEEGIYLQVECGMWNKFENGCEMNEMLWEETERILTTFGNHPSFVMLSPSNEPGGDWFIPLTDWVKRCKKMDGRRIYTAQSGWPYPMEPDQIGGTDYVYFHRSGYGIQPGGTIRSSKGWHGKDYRLSVKGIKYPVISHELGQWCSYPDYSIIDKFDGYLQPGNYKVFRESAKRHGVLDQAKEFAYLSGKLKVQMYKEEIEANFRTPHLYGFELLELHDYIGQGTAPVGFLDPFWEEKGFISAQEFKSFCSETVPLLRIAKRVYTRDEILDCPLEFSHFGREAISPAVIFWRLLNKNNEVVTEGRFLPMELPIKKNIMVGHIRLKLAQLQAPSGYELVVGIEHTSVKNSWHIWVYPSNEKAVPYEQVVYTHSFDRAMEALAQGKRVIYAPLPEHHRLDSPPLSAKPVFWNSQMGPTYSRGMGLVINKDHPALAQFPTQAYQEWQWEEIMDGAYGLNLKELPPELKPIVQPIDEWNRNYRMGMLLECNVLSGSLLIITADMDQHLEQRPAMKQFRTSLFAYAASPGFCPKVRIEKEALEKSFFQKSIMKDYHVKIKLIRVVTGEESSELSLKECSEEDYALVLDGDPNTFLTSNGLNYPFTLEAESDREVLIKGLLYMPRQNERTHKGDIKGCRVEAYVRGEWSVVYAGELASSYDPKELLFDREVKTARVRFTALYGFSAKGVCIDLESQDGWFRQLQDYQDTEAAIADLLFIPAKMKLKEDTTPLKEASPVALQQLQPEARSATSEIDY